MPTVAKCGQHKIWHWAHKSLENCDLWWESETEWHRNWKDRFPREWQECVHFDLETGEKHIADIKTDRGLVIEFQHSLMSLEELRSREQFYKNMVWIIDGCRLESDFVYFRLSLDAKLHDRPVAYSLQWCGLSKLFDNWAQATKPIFVDFGQGGLWRLLVYNRESKKGVVGLVKRADLVEELAQGESLPEWPMIDLVQNVIADVPNLTYRPNDDAQLSLC